MSRELNEDGELIGCPAIAALASTPSAPMGGDAVREALCRLYTAGYNSGHHDTVEGGFVCVSHSYAGEHFAEAVDELLADSDYSALAATPAPAEPAATVRRGGGRGDCGLEVRTAPPAATVERYTPEIVPHADKPYIHFRLEKDGSWMAYRDHTAALAERDAFAETLRDAAIIATTKWVAAISERKNAEQRVEALEGVLQRIAAPHDCGCVPCTGQCRSADSLSIDLECIRELASNAALARPPADGGA